MTEVIHIERNNGTGSFSFDGLEEIMNALSTPEWTIRDYLESKTHTLIFGESGCCKTFVALDMGLCVACGIEWCGEPVKQGPVFYVCGEGKGGIDRRIAAWMMRHQQSTESVPFFRSRKATRFYDEHAAAEVGDAINKLAQIHGTPVLVVIDTLAKNLGANENSNEDISHYFRHIDTHIVQRFGCSVITVHHVGHGEKNRARGAYALKSDFDADILIERSKDDHHDEVRVIPDKMKDAEPGRPLAFIPRVVDLGMTDEWGREVNSLVLDSTEYTHKTATMGLGKTQKKAVCLLNDMIEARRVNLKMNERDPEYARVELTEWKKELEAHGLLGKFPNQRWRVLKNALLDREAVSISGIHVTPAVVKG